MQTVSDGDVQKRFLEKPRFELTRKVYGIYMYSFKKQMNCLTALLGGLKRPFTCLCTAGALSTIATPLSVIVHALGIFRPSVIGCKFLNKLIPRKNFGIKDACVR